MAYPDLDPFMPFWNNSTTRPFLQFPLNVEEILDVWKININRSKIPAPSFRAIRYKLSGSGAFK